ncbi:hypothetical protein ACFL2A_01090 [Thermodesulfobacteriota bacterium]
MKRIKDELNELDKKNLYRRLKRVDSSQNARVSMSGKDYILLSSNNYLGLAADKGL